MKNRKSRNLLIAGVLIIGLAAGAIGIMHIRNTTGKDQKTAIDETFHTELFGENTYIFSPEDDPAEVQKTLNDIYTKQETNQFGEERYAVYFMPGDYDDSISIDVGFYTQIAGLGTLPTDTKIPKLQCLARWLGDDESNHNACCNFWRSVENVELESNTVWAVSQATDMRRVQVDGALYLHDDYGWCSGGFLSDSNITKMVDSGSQQQWLARNNSWQTWMGENWNLVFVGEEKGCAPEGTWPAKTYTTVDESPAIREKPFLIYDEKAGYEIYVPALQENASGYSWDEEEDARLIPMEECYIANPDTDTAQTMNEALADGKNLLLTPGMYKLDEPIKVTSPDTVVLGMGLATLQSVNGNRCMEIADEDGIIVAGLLFDAGTTETDNLLVVGEASNKEHSESPICLSDLYFRVGGMPTDAPAKADTCVTINSSNVIGDNFWVWRADHGDQVAWDANIGRNGIVVNGDDVTIYALMVEHFEEYQTIWNGNGGKVYMYQSEIPYDVPNQEAWMSHDGTVNGYASFKVDDAVTSFEATGLGIYLYNRDATVNLNSAMEMPDAKGVKVHNICSVMITGYPGMQHIINDSGKSVMSGGERQMILDYENGEYK